MKIVKKLGNVMRERKLKDCEYIRIEVKLTDGRYITDQVTFQDD